MLALPVGPDWESETLMHIGRPSGADGMFWVPLVVLWAPLGCFCGASGFNLKALSSVVSVMMFHICVLLHLMLLMYWRWFLDAAAWLHWHILPSQHFRTPLCVIEAAPYDVLREM